ncbi:hypothetical protein MTP99_004665 [Tenebrio molitor]|nr:hypothetical protein MTP99_004665 [Tenebrio molitor]
MKSKSAYEKVYVSFQGRNNEKSITEVTEDVILAFLDMRKCKDCQFSMAGHLHWMKQQKIKKKMLGTRARS